jgi:hypothetical protein
MRYSTKLKAYFILDELDEYEGVERETLILSALAQLETFPRKNVPKKIEEENMRTSQSVGVPSLPPTREISITVNLCRSSYEGAERKVRRPTRRLPNRAPS